MSEDTSDLRPASTTPIRKSWPQRVAGELRRHAYAYLILVTFAVVGAITAPLIFPEATPLMGVFGGVALGIFGALSAVPNKFLG